MFLVNILSCSMHYWFVSTSYFAECFYSVCSNFHEWNSRWKCWKKKRWNTKCMPLVLFAYITCTCTCSFQKHSLTNYAFVAQRIVPLLKKIVQEIERRISLQAEHLRTVCMLETKFSKSCYFGYLLITSYLFAFSKTIF